MKPPMPARNAPAAQPHDLTPDPEATVLSLCYGLARQRARLLRQAGKRETTPPVQPPARVLQPGPTREGAHDG